MLITLDIAYISWLQPTLAVNTTTHLSLSVLLFAEWSSCIAFMHCVHTLRSCSAFMIGVHALHSWLAFMHCIHDWRFDSFIEFMHCIYALHFVDGYERAVFSLVSYDSVISDKIRQFQALLAWFTLKGKANNCFIVTLYWISISPWIQGSCRS